MAGQACASLLKFEVGSTSDRVLISNANLAVNAGGGTISIVPLAGFGRGTYDLIDFPKGIATGLSNLKLSSGTINGYAAFLQSTSAAEQLVVGGLTSSSGTTTVTATGGTATAFVTPSQPGGGSFGAVNVTLPNVTQNVTLTDNFYENAGKAAVSQSVGSAAAGNINFQLAGNIAESWDLQSTALSRARPR